MNDDGKIDYSRYSYRELIQGLDTIDRGQYPLNYENLIAALEKIGPAERHLEDQARETVSVFDQSVHEDTAKGDPVGGQISHSLTALFVLSCGSYLTWVGDITLPGSTRRVIHVDGWQQTAMLVSMLLALAVLVSFVVDFFDTRDNRNDYIIFSGALDAAASILFLFSAFMSLSAVQ